MSAGQRQGQGLRDLEGESEHARSSGGVVSPVEARRKAQETPWVMHNESGVMLSNLSFHHFQGSNPYCSRFKSLLVLFKV